MPVLFDSFLKLNFVTTWFGFLFLPIKLNMYLENSFMLAVGKACKTKRRIFYIATSKDFAVAEAEHSFLFAKLIAAP